MIREVAYCYTEGSFCQTWIDGQVKKNAVDPKPQTNLIRPNRPAEQLSTSQQTTNRKDTLTNAISNEYYSSDRSSKAPEFVPQNFKCGMPSVRNKPKYPWGMLRIIGGKSAKKGQWPWQVAILNRFKVNVQILKKKFGRLI